MKAPDQLDMKLDTPNLDNIPLDELIAWQEVFALLAEYAQCLKMAHARRNSGYSDVAKKLETKADWIYQSLPEGVRW